MTSKERVVAALQRREPDRVPTFECFINPRIAIEMTENGNYLDLPRFLEIDGLAPNFISPDYASGFSWIDPLKGIFQDRWLAVRAMTAEGSFVIEHPIKSEADLRKYNPPDPKYSGVRDLVGILAERHGSEKAIVFLGRDSFIVPTFLHGMENLLVDFVDNPKFARRLIDMTVEYTLEVNAQAVAAGADVIVLGDDYAFKTNSIMSPAHFREFILPGLKRVVEGVKRSGAFCVKHSDGNVWGLLDMIVGTGVDAIGPLEPGAGMDLNLVKRQYGKSVCLIGNVDVDLLCRGTVEEVRSTVRKLIEQVAPGGGYILSSANTITSAVKPENFAAMVRACIDHGEYPIGRKRR